MHDARLKELREREAYRRQYQGMIVRLAKPTPPRDGGEDRPTGTMARISHIAVRGDASSPDGLRREVRLEFPDGRCSYVFADAIEVVGPTITRPWRCPFCGNSDEMYSDGDAEQALLSWDPSKDYTWRRECHVGSCHRLSYLAYRNGKLTLSETDPEENEST